MSAESILARVCGYLRTHRRAGLVDIAQGLDVSPDALRDMLAMLERKGRVRRLPSGTSCSGCSKCAPETIELYEWSQP